MRTAHHILTNLHFSRDFEVREAALRDLTTRLTEAPVDTQEALRSFTPEADPHQARVIEASDSTIRVVAPAGSGKTQTIINRAISRIRDGLSPSRLLILTFDNAAATSLRSKLVEQINDLGDSRAKSTVEELTISTLNSYGYGILREYFPEEYRRVVPASLLWRVVRDLKRSLRSKSPERYSVLPPNIEHRFYLEFFGLMKNELLDPRKLDSQRAADFLLQARQAEVLFADAQDEDTVKKVIQAVLWLLQAYDIYLRDAGFLDFDDQKLRAFACLRDREGVLRNLQRRLSEVIVDEFQDINRLDFVLIQQLAGEAGLVVTGDDDQAIYGFRGCSPEYIINLEKHVGRPVTSFELRINYRSPPNIVEHADLLIRHNEWRIAKEPVPHRTKPSEIKVVSTLSAGLEARSIVKFIDRIKRGQSSIGYKDFAVLYRTNAQSLPLQVEFILNGVPFYVRDEDNILTNQVLDRLLGILRLKIALRRGRKAAEDDQVATVQGYFRWVASDDARRLSALFAGKADFVGAIGSAEFVAIVSKAEKSALVPAVNEMLEAPDLISTLGVIARRFKGMSGMVGSLEDAVDRRIPLGEIYEVAANFGSDTERFVEVMEAAFKRARQSQAGKDEEGVALLTYFKSKGRQWHTVILTSCNEGLIPHKRAPIEDERRLFYVALTRASSNLLVSYVATACDTKVSPSRFLREAGLL